MKVRAFLEALRVLPVGTLDDLVGAAPFAVLSPHPDDESLGCGGLIAAACGRGQRCEVIVLTDGSGSHPHSETYPTAKLIALRHAETERAAEALGLPQERLTHLGLRDTAAPREGPAFVAVCDRIDEIIRRAKVETLFVTWGGDPHCDHEAAAAMAQALLRRHPHLRLWFYSIWGLHRDDDGEIDAPAPRGFRLAVDPWSQSKRNAIAAHASQMTDLIGDDPDGFRFTDLTLAPFLAPYEIFFMAPA